VVAGPGAVVSAPPGFGSAGLGLDAQSAFQRLDRTRELGHQHVAREGEDTSVGFLDLSYHAVDLGADAAVGFLLRDAHQRAVAEDVEPHGGSQAALGQNLLRRGRPSCDGHHRMRRTARDQ
jgi:hypothetical protein